MTSASTVGESHRAAQATWVVLHKPPGVVVSIGRRDRPTARELIDIPERLFAVGRLDVESRRPGVMTNDGAAAERLAHPRYEHEKEYRVLLNRPPDEDQLASWTRGLVLADGHRTQPARVWRETRQALAALDAAGAARGLKRQIRRSARTLGLRVERLIASALDRSSWSDESREWRLATAAELTQLTAPAKALRRPSRPPSGRRPSAKSRPGSPRFKER
jgi:23S rRNA pseudouridine2605 synthase